MVLYPRLRKVLALEKFEAIRKMPVETLRVRNPELSDDATFAQTGGRRINNEDLLRLRGFIEEIAVHNGFPGEVSESQRAAFDANCAVWLIRVSGIPLGEAFRDEMWSCLTIEVLPDISAWRFPGWTSERFIGGIRNTFQRLWMRAFLLDDPDDPTLLPGYMKNLKEDSFVQIVERPGASSNPRVATRIAAAWTRASTRYGTGPMEGVHRKVMKEITQRGAVVSFESVPPPELDRYLDSLFSEFGEATIGA